SLSFVTDPPGYPKTETRQVLPKIFARLNGMSSGEKLYVESPYFIVHDEEAKDQMEFLKEKNIQGVLLTNSLASTDAFYVAANFYPKISFYQNITQSEMYIYEGKSQIGMPLIRDANGKT